MIFWTCALDREGSIKRCAVVNVARRDGVLGLTWMMDGGNAGAEDGMEW